MDRTALLAQLGQALPVRVERTPLPPSGNVGLVVVDAVQGFTRRGSLSDPASMAPMVREVNRFVRRLDRDLGQRLRVLVLRDRHDPDVPEPPYPPHCIAGTGEERLDPDLAWLAGRAAIVDKDCINGFVGAMRPVAINGASLGESRLIWRNLLVEWVLEHRLRSLVLVGDCTDICVSDLALALLSARNHGMLTRATSHERATYIQAITDFSVYVHVPACATFDLDPDTELPHETQRHPGPVAHHVGLWLMASRGARLINGFESA